MSLPRKDAFLADLDNETITDLFRYACETDEAAADALEAEITRRGIYGRKVTPYPPSVMSPDLARRIQTGDPV